MALIKSKRYPEYYTYVGPANLSTIEYKVARFPGLDSLSSRIITQAVEYEVNRNNAKLLEVAVYSENSWWGIIPIYVIKITFKWYSLGVVIGEAPLIEPVTLIGIIAVAVATIFISIAAIVYFWTSYNVKIKHGYPPWYEGIFGKVALVLIVGAGAYALVKLTPGLYRKIYKQKKT